LNFFKKVFSAHPAVQQEQQMCSPRFDLFSLYTWELNFGPVQGHAHGILHHPLCFTSIPGTLNQECSLHGLGTRWGSCWGEFMKICVLFSLMSLIPKEVHDLTNFRGPDEKARLVSSQVGCVCNLGSKEVILLGCPMFQKNLLMGQSFWLLKKEKKTLS